MRRPGRPTQVARGQAGRPRVTRTQRNSSTIFTGELAGRSSSAGSSDGSTRRRSASPTRAPRTAARNVAYSSASTRPQPNARPHRLVPRRDRLRPDREQRLGRRGVPERDRDVSTAARAERGRRTRERGVRPPQRRELLVVQVRQRNRLRRKRRSEPRPPRRQRPRRTPGVVAAEMAASPGAEETQQRLAMLADRQVERRTGRVPQDGRGSSRTRRPPRTPATPRPPDRA